MQIPPTYTAPFLVPRLAGYFLRSGAADPAQMPRAALGTIGHAARQGIFIPLGASADLVFIGAALMIVLCIALYLHLLHAPHPVQPPIR